MNLSFNGDVYLANIGINQLDIRSSANLWAIGCCFQEAHIHSNAKLLLFNSEAWEVHTYEKGQILGFYDLPLFGKLVFAFPFGFVFYILILLAIAATTGIALFYLLQRKRQHTNNHTTRKTQR